MVSFKTCIENLGPGAVLFLNIKSNYNTYLDYKVLVSFHENLNDLRKKSRQLANTFRDKKSNIPKIIRLKPILG